MAIAQVLHVITLTFGCAIALIIRLWIYNITLHPLSKHPGPLLAKFTDFYATFHAIRGDTHLDIERLHQKHGAFVRYGPNKLLVNTAKGFHDIYDAGRPVKKAKTYIAHGDGNLIGIIDKAMYSRKKRVFSQGFSDTRIRDHAPKIQKELDSLCDMLLEKDEDPSTSSDSSWSSPKDMSLWSNYLTIDVITSVVFSTSWNLTRSRANERIPPLIQAIIKIYTLLHASPVFLSQLFDFYLNITVYIKRYTAIRVETLKVIEESMAVRAANPAVDDVFGQQLSHHKKDSDSTSTSSSEQASPTLSYSDLVRNSINFIIAGSDTVAASLSGTLFYLAHNPSTYASVANEIRTAFPTRGSVQNGPKLQSCKLLQATIMEAMRHMASDPTPHWREVEQGGIVIDGEHIPAGVNVASCSYSVHHNPRCYPEPWRFDIHRWLAAPNTTEEGNAQQKQNTYAWIPFSTGPRQCLAKNFAMMELQLALATVLVRMDFALADGELGRVGEGDWAESGWAAKTRWGRQRKDEFQVLGYLTPRYEGPFLKFRGRTEGQVVA